jgi:hypothetical protein
MIAMAREVGRELFLMRSTLMRSGLVAVLLCLLAAPSAHAQIADPLPDIPAGEIRVEVEFVVELPDSGSMSRPTARPMTLVGDGSGRRFVADQNGLVYQIHPDDSLSLFLDVAAATSLFANFGLQGLNSIAFHPDYFESTAPGFQRFYTASSQTAASGTPDFLVPVGAPTSHHAVVHEWQVMLANPNAIDPASVREVLRIGVPHADHPIGQIAFDPATVPGDPDHGLLFIAMGDGGSPTCCPPLIDPLLVGQDLSSPLGTLLRIDPLQVGGASYSAPADNPFASDEDSSTLDVIWAWGLRNPHRFAFDAGSTGRLLLSDIGASNIEEVNWVVRGANYGWSEREGTFLVTPDDLFNVFPLPPNDATFGFSYPVLQYDHDEGDRAISGGYVYRGSGVSQIVGDYIFGDLVSGRLFRVPVEALDGSGQVAFEQLRLIDSTDGLEKSLLEMIGGGIPAPRADLRFGRDDAGEIYLVTKRDGSVRRLIGGPIAVPGLSPFASAALVALLLATNKFVLHAKRLRSS